MLAVLILLRAYALKLFTNADMCVLVKIYILFITFSMKLVVQCEIHELLALVYYDSLQNVVPFYDQRSVLPLKDAAWMMFCESSMRHFKKAFTLKYTLFAHVLLFSLSLDLL